MPFPNSPTSSNTAPLSAVFDDPGKQEKIHVRNAKEGLREKGEGQLFDELKVCIVITERYQRKSSCNWKRKVDYGIW